MINTSKYLRKDLQSFIPYYPLNAPYKHKLDANESPFGLTDKVKEKLVSWLNNDEELNIYPDTDSTDLRRTIAAFWNIAIEEVVCGVGSDQLIDYIAKAFLEPCDFVLVEKPSFSMYELTAKLNHGQVAEVELDENFMTKSEIIIATARECKSRVIFLCTPNNPTGGSLSQEEILRVAAETDSVVVVDEAYADFSGQTVIPFINEYKNLLVLRTFSKAYGLAGARVGYALGCEEIISALNIVRAPYNLPTVSQILAAEALRDSEEYKQRTLYLTEQRDEMFNTLQSIPWLKVYPSDANFLFIDSEKEITDILQKNGILIRKFVSNDIQYRERVRLSIGNIEQNKSVLDVIRTL